MKYKLSNYGPSDWDRIILNLQTPHVLQTWEWGAFKSKYGWSSEQLVWSNNGYIAAAAMVLKRSLEIPFIRNFVNILYIPRGPILDWKDNDLSYRVLKDISEYAKINRGLFVKIDPEIIMKSELSGNPDNKLYPNDIAIKNVLKNNNWLFSRDQIQFQNTLVIDLTPSEDELLANMKQKTRYNVRLASRKGVTVRRGNTEDIGLLYQMYAETALRDGFTIRNEQYYTSVWGSFIKNSFKEESSESSQDAKLLPAAEPLIAEVDGEPVAAIIIFRFGRTAWYLYGMSRAVHREKMPNYLLQWEAIKRAKEAGCQTYDLWGAPNKLIESDPLWGVYRFKEGLGGKVVQYIGAWDLPIQPVLYSLYSYTLPRMLNLMRIRGRRATKDSLLE